jgi:hypothetical protein
MGKKIALIDSERISASKYADRFEFDTVDLQTKKVEEYVNLINEAAKEGYEVLIIDSLTHAWQTLNEEVELIADARYKGNFWAAWSEGTPMQRKLIDALVSYPGHIIATMRSKTEWQTGGGEGSKSRPIRVGLAPEQGKGIEYEFDILFEITPEHLATIIKDRTGKFQDKIIEKPGREFGEELVAWLNESVVSLDSQVQETLLEIGRIIQSKSEKDVPYFAGSEIDSIRAMCKGSIDMPKQERLDFLQNVLNDQKNLLHERVAVENTPKPQTQPTEPVEVKNPEEKTLSDNFKEIAAGKQTTETVTETSQSVAVEPETTPSMFNEPEPDEKHFEDDIPFGDEELVTANEELDIF